MKVAAGLILVLALVAGIVPQLTDCQSQGRAIALANGKTVPMKCHWTAQAEIALAVPLAGLAALLAFNRRKETQRNLGIMGTLLGAFVALVPMALIGVCASPDMLCNSVMQPTLILAGTLIAATSLFVVVRASAREPQMLGAAA
jgi:hypothetical protein